MKKTQNRKQDRQEKRKESMCLYSNKFLLLVFLSLATAYFLSNNRTPIVSQNRFPSRPEGETLAHVST